MLIRDLFASDVTRDIPPVVYLYEQSPRKLQDEVGEYIVTGGWPEKHPHKRRVPNGIHEQFVRLLTGMRRELQGRDDGSIPGACSLPASWISGFYGSGKSIFAKLLGLALADLQLPDGRPLHEALLARDTSPRAPEFRAAWEGVQGALRQPVAVVFDIGAVARDNEQIHSAVVRRVQLELGYCSTQALVAEFELKLERDGLWDRFEQVAREQLGRPWAELKDMQMAEEDFSEVMAEADSGVSPIARAKPQRRKGRSGAHDIRGKFHIPQVGRRGLCGSAALRDISARSLDHHLPAEAGRGAIAVLGRVEFARRSERSGNSRSAASRGSRTGMGETMIMAEAAGDRSELTRGQGTGSITAVEASRGGRADDG